MARKNNDMRPGHGWKHLSGSVYERIDGLRMHMGGMCRLLNGDKVSASSWDQYSLVYSLIEINGGNRKRGLMAWAAALAT
jgi:hypothetical protein